MNEKLITILQIGILIVAFGCTKNNPDNNGGGSSTNNIAPTCSITRPQNGATFAYDENINVTVFAEDSDGTIEKVSLYIDNVGYSELTTFPYNFTFVSGIMSPGTHTIKAIAKDNEGSNGESSVTITIEQPATESPDFVSFSDGQIPPTWQTATWYVDNTGGYDDIYSLKVVGEGSVMTTKTIQGKGYLEFFVKSNENYYFNHPSYTPYLKLYIDGSTFFYYTVENIGSWEKYIVDLDEGAHTFLWEFYNYDNSQYLNIDAIRFIHNSTNHRIGDYHQGGYIAYLDNTRQHGYIISENDLGLLSHSDAINACNNYSVGQYSDWRLPDINDLTTILKSLWMAQSTIIPPISSISSIYDTYWSSSMTGSNGTYYFALGLLVDGISSYYQVPSNSYCKVRAIRSF